MVDVQRVVHVTRRVAGREVERPEVVPLRLDLGALRHRVAHGAEHVLEAPLRLRDDVQPPHLRGLVQFGEVEALGLQLSAALRCPQLVEAHLEAGTHLRQCLAEGASRSRTIRGRQRTQAAPQARQRRSLAEQVGAGRGERGEIGGGPDGGDRRLGA